MVDTVCDQPLMDNERTAPISAFTIRLTIADYLIFLEELSFYDSQHDGFCRW